MYHSNSITDLQRIIVHLFENGTDVPSVGRQVVYHRTIYDPRDWRLLTVKEKVFGVKSL